MIYEQILQNIERNKSVKYINAAEVEKETHFEKMYSIYRCKQIEVSSKKTSKNTHLSKI